MTKVNLATGQVEHTDLGVAMTHVHLTVDCTCYLEMPSREQLRDLVAEPISLQNRSAMIHNAFRMQDQVTAPGVDVMVSELEEYTRVGGRTVVNMELPGLGRNVAALREISQRSGVQIVVSTGWYVERSHPPEVATMDVGQLADVMVREVTEGIGDSGIRAGNIGEIGLSGDDGMRPNEERVLRAAARAQRRTGVPITIHPSRSPRSVKNFRLHSTDHFDRYLEILEGEGADLEKLYISHLGYWLDPTVSKRVLERGVGFVSYDGFGLDEYFGGEPGEGFPSDREEVTLVATMLDAGYVDRILISNQGATKTSLRSYGGGGYAHVHETILPWISRFGASRADLDKILIENPRRLFA